jgi:hypothetical protein
MTRGAVVGGASAALGLLVFLVVRYPAPQTRGGPVAPAPVPAASSSGATDSGFIYGRITGVDGGAYEGRLRWGGDQEAFWGDYFNGTKADNPWASQAPLAEPPPSGHRIEIFGLKLGEPDGSINLRRQFMARFGDIARIDANVRHVQVTLKSGTTFTLDRFAAGDIDDGVRVWDGRRGVVNLDTRQIRTIEFLAGAPAVVPGRLYGTVRTSQGDFTGFIQWNQQESVDSDELEGRTGNGELGLRYDTIRSIARHSRDSALVTLRDGREIVLSDRDVGHRSRGVYVDDPRYGRVLISWDAFERVEFSPGGSGPGYRDFQPGRALAGTIITRAGRRLAGRLVYDFDESETTETLDAALPGVDYNIPFSLLASILLHGQDATIAGRATVLLSDGEALHLERTGDLAASNAGVLVFVDGRPRPDYVRWMEVAQVDFDRAPAMSP